jgi:hypothetical protein
MYKAAGAGAVCGDWRRAWAPSGESSVSSGWENYAEFGESMGPSSPWYTLPLYENCINIWWDENQILLCDFSLFLVKCRGTAVKIPTELHH